jgi:hypothetical protein
MAAEAKNFMFGCGVGNVRLAHLLSQALGAHGAPYQGICLHLIVKIFYFKTRDSQFNKTQRLQSPLFLELSHSFEN